ncbi:hypothetical protein CI15_09165 [Paraburkholderia monticola]|uniref:DUF469 domain-containing protein n=1 Tax=Paraburkholderia monticola TaxID=1399968 RepID=A0A149PW33_9BURK|nr:YggL family protein [Paraburkholderia monticola]KXU89199.1 hypothetical protein CI15_09165 [Paraburkholderia monticola]
MSKRHNRRQRKKLHLDEFQEFGFFVAAKYQDQLDARDREDLLDEFLAFIEANGMLAAVSTDTCVDAYLISEAARGSATEDHRQLVRAWLENRSELNGIEVRELSDAWYPPVTVI